MLSENEVMGSENFKKDLPVSEDKTKTNELLDEFEIILSSEKQEVSDEHPKDIINSPNVREHNDEVTVNGVLTI